MYFTRKFNSVSLIKRRNDFISVQFIDIRTQLCLRHDPV